MGRMCSVEDTNGRGDAGDKLFCVEDNKWKDKPGYHFPSALYTAGDLSYYLLHRLRRLVFLALAKLAMV